jgi:hypothetical protein
MASTKLALSVAAPLAAGTIRWFEMPAHGVF